jgi:hypothetical protein
MTSRNAAALVLRVGHNVDAEHLAMTNGSKNRMTDVLTRNGGAALERRRWLPLGAVAGPMLFTLAWFCAPFFPPTVIFVLTRGAFA